MSEESKDDAMTKRADSVYLQTQWYEDRDPSQKRHSQKLVVTRKPQTCYGNGREEEHTLPAGTRALYEKCLYDGQWKQNWLCVDCMDRWLDQMEGSDDE